jgi:hypothetical protein
MRNERSATEKFENLVCRSKCDYELGRVGGSQMYKNLHIRQAVIAHISAIVKSLEGRLGLEVHATFYFLREVQYCIIVA